VEVQQMDTQPLWRAEDVAQYLAVPVSTVRYWTSKGFIPHIKLPAAVRFEPDVIVEWMRAMSKGTQGAQKPEEIASEILSSQRIRLASSRKTSKA
jgi:excisionase family DNA binding protein